MNVVSAPAWIGLIALALTVGGCAPAGFVPYDRNTKYRVDNGSSGFTLTVALNYADGTITGVASDGKTWTPVHGSFEVVR